MPETPTVPPSPLALSRLASPLQPGGPETEPPLELPARRGALPDERDNWRDTGCDLYPSCLTCPLPRCRYDQRAPDQLRTGRNNAIRSRRAAGETPEAIAQALGLSRRTIFRVLAAD